MYHNAGEANTPVTASGYTGEAATGEVADLDGGTSYVFAITATNEYGEGPRAFFEVSTAPPIVANLRSTHQTTGSITLHWDAPVVKSGDVPTGYRVFQRNHYRYSDLFESSDVFTDDAWTEPQTFDQVLEHFFSGTEDDLIVDTLIYHGQDDPTTSTEVTSLRGGTTYEFTLHAESGSGSGELCTSIMQSTAPSVPLSVVAAHQSPYSVSLAWEAPTPDGDRARAAAPGDPVTGYQAVSYTHLTLPTICSV